MEINKKNINPSVISTKSPTAVLLLCVFLGSFGIHRFYVGKIGTGILMLLTFGGLGIWYLIDLAFIISNKFTDKQDHIIELAKSPPRFKKVITIFGILIIVFYGFWISVFTTLILATNALIEVAENQLNALRMGDLNKAYAYTSVDFKHNTTPENFRQFVEHYQLETNESASFSSTAITVGAGDLKGTLRLRDGTVLLIEYRLKEENNQWKIQDIELKK
jgi:hypothetical protein